MVRKRYMADTETTTGEFSNEETHVWAWALCEIGKEDDMRFGNTIDTLVEYMSNNPGDYYFHNMKFDGSFILSYLLNHGYTHNTGKRHKPKTFKTIISTMNQWYSIDVCVSREEKHVNHFKILDSYKKLPFKVKDIAVAFNIKEHKTSINYDTAFNDKDWIHNPKIREYISNDVKIVSKALNIQFHENMKKMTIGSDSLSSYKDKIGKREYERRFPKIPELIDNDIRKAYRGGFVWTNPRFANQDIGEGMVYDVNSLYPSRMRNSLLPYGAPVIFEGRYHEDKSRPLYIQSLRCEFELKEGFIPTIQIKNNLAFRGMDNEYLTSSKGEQVLLVLSNPDIDLLFKHYNVTNIEYVGGYKFSAKHGMFNEWVDHFMHIKEHATGAIRQLSKLRLNNLYGKFATSLDLTGREPYLDDNGVLRFKTLPKEIGEGQYIPMGVFITAWARHYTISTAQRCYDRILYCDTDSIHIKGTEIPLAIKNDIDPAKLGYWKHESTFRRGRFLRPKTYIEDIDCEQSKVGIGDHVSFPFKTKQNKEIVKIYKNRGEKWFDVKVDNTNAIISLPARSCYHIHIRCAGMQDNTRNKVTWDNFHFGFEDNFGRLIPEQVKGGIILKQHSFQIKV